MKIRVSELKHHPLNKSIYILSDINDLSKNINEVGLLQPIVIDEKKRVISGNRRLEAIKKLKWKYVEVFQTKIKTEDIPFMLVSYNKQRVKSVKEIVNEIKVLQKYYGKKRGERTDLTSANIGGSSKNPHTRETISKEIGVSSGNIQKIILIDKTDPKFIDLIDDGLLTINQAYLQIQRRNKEDDYINTQSSKKRNRNKNENFIIYKKSSHNLSEIEDEYIQTIFTSPPYWNKRIYYRVLKPKGSFFLNLGDTFYEGDLQNIPHRVVLGLKEVGWILRNTIIWSKTNPKPSSSKTNLTPSYEFIFHLVKNNNYYYNQLLTEFSSTPKVSHAPRHRGVNKNTNLSISPYIPRLGKNIGDYWSEDVVKTAVSHQKIKVSKEHPAPFPKELVILPILQTSKEGDLILDPFCGTGTTGIISNEYNRKFIGYDIKIF